MSVPGFWKHVATVLGGAIGAALLVDARVAAAA